LININAFQVATTGGGLGPPHDRGFTITLTQNIQ